MAIWPKKLFKRLEKQPRLSTRQKLAPITTPFVTKKCNMQNQNPIGMQVPTFNQAAPTAQAPTFHAFKDPKLIKAYQNNIGSLPKDDRKVVSNFVGKMYTDYNNMVSGNSTNSYNHPQGVNEQSQDYQARMGELQNQQQQMQASGSNGLQSNQAGFQPQSPNDIGRAGLTMPGMSPPTMASASPVQQPTQQPITPYQAGVQGQGMPGQSPASWFSSLAVEDGIGNQ